MKPEASPSENLQWTARPAGSPRSVFSNFKHETSRPVEPVVPLAPGASAEWGAGGGAETRQAAIDTVVARSFLHRFLAQAFEDPTREGWNWLTSSETLAAVRSAVHNVRPGGKVLLRAKERMLARLQPGEFESFHSACLGVFGHAARGQCPLNEIEYGNVEADALCRPHCLADLAGFYRAFGLEVTAGAGERQDHLCVELEFMSVLAAKEACALKDQPHAEHLLVCRDARKKFLREHLGRWTPAFTRILAALAGDTALGALAHFTRAFIESECACFGVAPGGEDLRLRPADVAAESLNASPACGWNVERGTWNTAQA